MNKIKLAKYALILLSLFFIYSISIKNIKVFADESDLQKKLAEIENRKTEYKNKLNELLQQQQTLTGRIAYIDNLLSLIEIESNEAKLKLSAKEAELESYNIDINSIRDQLNASGSELKTNESYYNNIIYNEFVINKLNNMYKDTYIYTNIDVAKKHYLLSLLSIVINKEIKSHVIVTDKYNDIQSNLNLKANILSQLNESITFYKNVIEAKKSDLEFQKKLKMDLIVYTKANEENYQKLLKQAEDEQKAIEDAINSAGESVSNKSYINNKFVNKNDVIGRQGSTGFSTGEHLHFSVYIKCENKWCNVDPFTYLNSGELNYPVKNFRITQGYGVTDYAKSIGFYKNHFHNGIDLVGEKGGNILAAEDGYIKYTKDAYGANGAIIIHNDNLMTAYWHLR